MSRNRRRTFGAWIARPESIIGICAVIVSVVAVAVAAYEARLERRWQRAAVWPHIQLDRSYYQADSNSTSDARGRTLTLNAENVGVGPAHIRDFHVTVDGKPQATWGAMMQALLGTAEEIQYGQSTILGTILPPQRRIELLQLSSQPHSDRIYGEMNRLEFLACFCSVFDECWQTSYRVTQAQKVEHCTPDENSFKE
jgi:hypothetical protein